MWKEIRKNYRRLIASLLTLAMVITNAGGNLGTIFAAGETENALFLLEGKELREAIQEAEESGEIFDFSTLQLAAGKKSIKTRYEKLLGKKEGDVYALELEIDDSYAPEGTDLQVFYHAETGNVIFLFLNESDLVVDYRVNIDGYETEPVRVNPNSANIEEDGEDTSSYAENYEAADMIDDEGKKLGAEVLNPTEMSGEEEDKGDVSGNETGEEMEETEGQTGEDSQEDIDKKDTSEGTEGTTEAGDEMVNGSNDTETGTPEEKEEGRDVSESETEAETEKAEEAGTEEAETVSDEEEEADGELLSISLHEAAIVTISVDELDGREAETEEETEAFKEAEAEKEAETEKETETETETENGTETKDEPESKADESETKEESEADITDKAEENESEADTENKTEESEAGTEEENKMEEGGSESGGNTTIEETDKNDGTETSDEKDSSADTDSDENIGTDRIEIEGQLLEDDSIEILGELKGKEYDTVTILDHVNARAWKIALEDMEAVISMECEHEYIDGVCAICEAQCPHEERDEDGNCIVCGMAEEGLDEKFVPAKVYTAETDDAVFTVDVPDGAFEEEVELKASKIQNETELKVYADQANEALAADKVVAEVLAYDLSFISENTGEEVEPVKTVSVNIQFKKALVAKDGDDEQVTGLSVVHLPEDEDAEVMTSVDSAKEAEIEFKTDSFSLYAVTLTANAGASIEEKGYATMQKAIDDAKDGDTIRLEKEIHEYVEIKKKNITIDLNGQTWKSSDVFNDQGTASIITVSESTLTLVGDGKITGIGNNKGYRTITAKDTKLTIGKEGDDSAEGPVIEGYDNNFSMKETVKKGGVILLEGGSLVMYSGTVTKGRISLSDSYGGGIAVVNGSGFTMHGGSITGNTTYANGGGVSVENTPFIMEGGAIRNNKIQTRDRADSYGAGVYVKNADFTMKNGVIESNTFVVQNSVKKGKFYGGGIYALGNFANLIMH